jgi:hypothetical protein
VARETAAPKVERQPRGTRRHGRGTSDLGRPRFFGAALSQTPLSPGREKNPPPPPWNAEDGRT